MKLIFLSLFLLLITIQACDYTKNDAINCIMKFDRNKDKQIDSDEILKVCEDKMAWYEKIIYRPSWIVDQFRTDCGLPITDASSEVSTCFKSCFYRTHIYEKLCT